MTDSENGATVKRLAEMLVNTASSSATILERLEQFKTINASIVELRRILDQLSKDVGNIPDNLLDRDKSEKAFSDLFDILRNIKADIDAIKPTIPSIDKNITELAANMRTVVDQMAKIPELHQQMEDIAEKNMTCPGQKHIDKLSGGYTALISKLESVGDDLPNMEKRLVDFQIKLANAIVTPRWVWMVIIGLVAIAIMAWSPKAASVIMHLIK